MFVLILERGRREGRREGERDRQIMREKEQTGDDVEVQNGRRGGQSML